MLKVTHCLSLLAAVLALSTGLARSPNVVLIISDDQGWTDYGFMGHPVIRTPHLDRLAAESAVFPRGYVPSSLCRPSLASIITGLYPHQHKITGNDPRRPGGRPGWSRRNEPEYLPLLEKLTAHIDDVATIPRMLAKKGYRSFQSGKWWEGSYKRGGFTHGMTHGEVARGGRHGDDGLAIGRKGMEPIFEFIDACGEAPFFLWYAPFLPHTPHNPPSRLLERYRATTESPHVARYRAMCEWFDETCGELLSFLDKRHLAENTLVIFVCDNGWVQEPDRATHTARSKRSPYDGGIRTPILLRWPGRIRPGRHDDLVMSLDIAPTVLGACGVDAPEDLPGIDLISALEQGHIDRSIIFGEVFEHDVFDIDDPARSLLYRWSIEGSWKLISDVKDGTAELYDLGTDAAELHDLSLKKPETVKRLRARLDAWWNPAVTPGGPGTARTSEGAGG